MCQAVHGCASRLLRLCSYSMCTCSHTVENDLTSRRAYLTVCLYTGLLSQQFIQEPLRLIYTQEPDVLFHS